MNWMTLVLGETFILLFAGAVIAGLWSAYSKGQILAGTKPFKVDDDARRDSIGKAAILAVYAALIYFDSDDLTDALIRVSAPVGIYKIVQSFLTPFFVWRLREAQTLVMNPEPSDG